MSKKSEWLYLELQKGIAEEGGVACQQNPDAWFPDLFDNPKGWHHERELAIALCHECPLILLCRAYAQEADEEYGIWGGLNYTDRREIRQGKRPLTA